MKPAALLTLTEVSEILRRPRFSIYELVRSGRLAAVRDGPKLLKFRSQDVEAYISRNLQTAKGLESSPGYDYVKKGDPLSFTKRRRNVL